MGDKVYLGKAPVSLDPALQKGESVEDRNERLRTGKFEDERGVFEKNIAPRLNDALNYLTEENERHKSKPIKKAKGGKISSASKRADGCCTKGKTRGKMV